MNLSSGIILRKYGVILPLLLLTACSSLNHSKPAGTEPAAVSLNRPVNNAVLAPMGAGIIGTNAAQFSAADRRAAIEAEYKALEYAPKGVVVSWKGRSGQTSGEVTAAQPYQVGSQNCRQYNHNFTVDGTPQIVRGTACRNEDGSWSPLT